MSTAASKDWTTADRAYQGHHAGCSACIAAGKNPALQRCAEGRALWEAYNQAGEPPHFLWLQQQKPEKRRAHLQSARAPQPPL